MTSLSTTIPQINHPDCGSQIWATPDAPQAPESRLVFVSGKAVFHDLDDLTTSRPIGMSDGMLNETAPLPAYVSDLKNRPFAQVVICYNVRNVGRDRHVDVTLLEDGELPAGLRPWFNIGDEAPGDLTSALDTTARRRLRDEERSTVMRSSQRFFADLLDQRSTYMAGGFTDWLAPYALTLSHKTESLRAEFIELVRRWRRERGYTSFTAEIVRCPSYRKIVAMGEDALPLIFERLRDEGDNPDHWDFALSEITGCDPVPEEAYGYMDRIAACWLEWAEENGFGR